MRTVSLVVTAIVISLSHHAVAGEKLTTLHTFTGRPDGADPSGNLVIQRRHDDIFGATQSGGAGLGTVFELMPPSPPSTAWTETILWSPRRPKDGEQPSGGVVSLGRGALFGTTTFGGETQQCGTVFRLKHVRSEWRHEVLHNFAGGASDGCQPSAAVNFDGVAVLGTTLSGGANNDGTVFKIEPWLRNRPGEETVIWSFSSAVDGAKPSSQMMFGRDGNLYGTTSQGGPGGQGTVWKLTPPAQKRGKWTMTVLWTFSGADGAEPTRGPLVFDATGALYGTCHSGGAHHEGVVFKLTPPQGTGTAWTEDTIYNFDKNVGNPTSGVVIAPKGDLIGATSNGSGAIFRLSPPDAGHTKWKEKLLWQFDGTDGADPELPVTLGVRHGVVFGTTMSGGRHKDRGTVWELSNEAAP